MRAVVSDIHSNIEALQAVMNDMERRGVDEIICVGDVIGYGPNPRECIDIAKDFGITLQGNHDEALLFDPAGFTYRAKTAMYWTKDQLDVGGDEGEKNIKRWDFMGELSQVHTEDNLMFLHGTPRDPVREYLFPYEIINARKIELIFEKIDKLCFVGHTHVPGVFIEDATFIAPQDIGDVYVFDDEKKAIVNVGSVGQPRNGDTRSSYVILDDDRVTFCHVEYDFEKTMEKIYAVDELDSFLADRLKDGR